MLDRIKSLGLTEIILIQVILWIGIWLMDDYLGSLLTVVFVPILFFVLIISLIAEWIEPSKIPKKYFSIFFTSIIVPSLIAAFVFYAYEGSFDWLNDL